MQDILWMTQLGALVGMLVVYAKLVSELKKYKMIIKRLQHHAGIDDDGNPIEGHHVPDSTWVRNVVRESIEEGTLSIESERDRRSGA